jgi:hypothetical protein
MRSRLAPSIKHLSFNVDVPVKSMNIYHEEHEGHEEILKYAMITNLCSSW